MSYSISITIDTSKLDKILDLLDSRADKVVEEYAQKAESSVKDLAPIDTGALKNSIHTINMGYAWRRIQPEVGMYALYQELGFHHHYSGNFIQNPYLTPGVEMHASSFLSPNAWRPLFT